jgi:hypothetical protein
MVTFAEILILFIILTILIILLGFSLLAAHIVAMHRFNK